MSGKIIRRASLRTARLRQYAPHHPAPPHCPQHDDNCPLRRHPPARTLVTCVVYTKASRRSREGRNLASPPPADSPRPLGEGQGERSDDRKCNQMQPNATELKGSPLLATRNEANPSHYEATLAQRVRVSGVPNEATANYGNGLAHSHLVVAERTRRWRLTNSK